MASSSVAISPSPQTDFRKMNKQALCDALASRGLDTNGLRPSLIQRLENSVKALAAAEAPSTSVANKTLTSKSEISQGETLMTALLIGTQTEGGTQTLTIHSGNLMVSAEGTLKSHDEAKTQEPTTVSRATKLSVDTMKASASRSGTARARIIPFSTIENRKRELKSSSTTHLSDLDRKRMRAERFGVGLQVSEKEKLLLRAERFAGAEGKKNSTVREPESEKRKQRAARFGIVDDEARKKTHEEQFASAPNQDLSVEVDKRKARAARFGAPIELAGSKQKSKG